MGHQNRRLAHGHLPLSGPPAILTPLRPQSIVVMQRFCKPQSLVRFRVGAPRTTGKAVMTRLRLRTSWFQGLSTVLLVILPWAPSLGATSTPCGKLCAHWQLDAPASTDPTDAINAAMAAYKEEKIRRRRTSTSDLATLANAELDESLGPLRRRPEREELHEQLARQLVIPKELRFAVEGEDVVLDEGRSSPRRFHPGEPYARVDSVGTARISIQWQQGTFVVYEDYKRNRSNRETYAIEPRGERLIVTRSIERPALPNLVVRSIYRPLAKP